MDIDTRQESWTSTNKISAIEHTAPVQSPCKSTVTGALSVLYNPVKRADLEINNIVVHNNCPPSVLKHIQKHLEWTIPVLSIHLPNSPCWKYLGAPDPDGYARHNPRTKKLPKEAQRSSHLLHRFIYQWLFMPQGIPERTSDGERIEVDHVCGRGTKRCINPLHLQLLPRKLNQELGDRNDY